MNRSAVDAAVLILLGQSNASGHGVPMSEKERITCPMRNVFGLRREENQSFFGQHLIWSGYTSAGTDLGEDLDDTWSVANALALCWQEHIDAGNAMNLPDLYIVQIAVGAQGVTEEYMWYPHREKQLIPGPLGTVDISLYSFSMHIFSLLADSFSRMGKTYQFIGLHWRGGENDITVPAESLRKDLPDIYRTLFGGFSSIFGEIPVILHRIVCHDRANDLDPSGQMAVSMEVVNEVFDRLAEENPQISVFDIRCAPHYIPDVRGNGLFIGDAVHYTAEVNRWLAETIMNDYGRQ